MDADQTPDENTDEVFDITTATETQLRDREAALREQIETLRSEPRTLENVTAITELRSERNVVVDAVNAIIELGALDGADVMEAITEAAPAVEDTPEVEAAPADTDTTAMEAQVDDSTPDTDTTLDDEAAALVAADEVLAGTAHVAAADRPTAPAYTRPRVAYVAGAGQTAFAQGVDLDYDGLARAWESRRLSIKPGMDGARTRAVVAALPSFDETADVPVASLNHTNGIHTNDNLIRESVAAWRQARTGAPGAHVAAICDPLDIIRDIPAEGIVDSPFSDVFPQRPVGRLGFQFTRASSLTVAASGVDIWTESDQDAVDADNSATWKPTVQIECSTPAEVTAEELVTSATVDNSVQISSPERVREFMHKLAVARARRREQYLLGLFDATASEYTYSTGTYGTLPGTIAAIETVLPQLLYAERLDEGDYDLVIDPGFLNKLIIDENKKGYGEPVDVLAKLRAQTGLNVVVLRDFVGSNPFQTPPTPGAGASAATALPSANTVRLVPAGAYIFGATGEESTGWQTDPQLARQNRVQAFSAEWLMLAKHGEHPAATISVTSNSNGGRGGFVTPA